MTALLPIITSFKLYFLRKEKPFLLLVRNNLCEEKQIILYAVRLMIYQIVNLIFNSGSGLKNSGKRD